jgi:HAD superfamily hydrolase (TIGR01662 family)
MKPRAVLFDLGDTLWPHPGSHPHVVEGQYALARRVIEAIEGMPSDDVLGSTIDAALAAERERYAHGPNRFEQPPTHEVIGRALKGLGLHLPDDIVHAYSDALIEEGELRLAERTPAEPDMPIALRGLVERGLRLGLVTNNAVTTIGIERILAARGIDGFMECIVASCEAGYRKPHAGCFEPALEALGARAGECIAVGDRVDTDILGAKQLGMHAVQTRQYRKIDQMPAAQPDIVIEHISELLPFVDTLLKQ